MVYGNSSGMKKQGVNKFVRRYAACDRGPRKRLRLWGKSRSDGVSERRHSSAYKNAAANDTKSATAWRSGRDSNPRSRLRDYSISSRARYDLFDTAPNQQSLLYHIFSRIARGKAEKIIVFSENLCYNYVLAAEICKITQKIFCKSLIFGVF